MKLLIYAGIEIIYLYSKKAKSYMITCMMINSILMNIYTLYHIHNHAPV